MLIEQENISRVFKAVFETSAGKAVLEHLQTLYDLPADVNNSNREYWNAGRREVLRDITKFINFNQGEK